MGRRLVHCQSKVMERILIVDDDHETRVVLEEILRRAGYSVSIALGGSDAVRCWRTERIDLAVVELRKSLYPAPNHAWEGWNEVPGNGVISRGLTMIPNAGLAGTPMTIEVNVDAPAQLIDPSTAWQYYRVRTLGTMPLTGPSRVGFDKEDNRLRKLTLRLQRFIDDLFASETDSPHAARRVESVVAPVSSFALPCTRHDG